MFVNLRKCSHYLLGGLLEKAFLAAYSLRIKVRAVSNTQSPETPPVTEPLAQVIRSGRMHHALVVPDRNVVLIDPPVPDMDIVVNDDHLLQPVHDLSRLDLRQAVDALNMVAEAVYGVPLLSVSPRNMT